MIEIMVDLQGGAKAPLYEKIYKYMKCDIIAGRIPLGEKLPSTRLLAKNLAVSRSTVEMAYDQLQAEGYIRSEPCRGFFVCDVQALYRMNEEGTTKEREIYPSQGQRITGREIDFSPYAIDASGFPFSIWQKISKNIFLDEREELLYAGDGQGDYELRSEIVRYLHQARGVRCQASDLIIGAGNEYLEILLVQLLGKRKTVLMDEPGYPRAYRTFCNMGYRVKTIPAGEDRLSAVEGIDTDIVYMMPSHQFPMGTVMPLSERLSLLKWAAEKEGRYLIEDDHDSEYRYRGRPIPSMQSVDGYDKVVYLGTFSKSIAPSLRISYMILPHHLMEQYHKKCGFYSNTVPRMQQEILKIFIRDGYFERHLNRMRGVYRKKHDFLLGQLRKRAWVEQISGEYAGLHVLVQVKTCLREDELCARAMQAGISISGISQYYLTGVSSVKEAKYPIILLGYGKPGEDEIGRGLTILDEILKEYTGLG